MRDVMRSLTLSAAMAVAAQSNVFCLLEPELPVGDYRTAYERAAAEQRQIYLLVGPQEPELAAFVRTHCQARGHCLAVEERAFVAGGREFTDGVYRFDPPPRHADRPASLPAPLVERRQLWMDCPNGQCGARQ